MILATLALLQEHGPAAGEGGLPAPFRLEPGLMVWTWAVFLTLLFLLWKYAWPSIVRLTEEREKKIAQQLAEAERANKDAQAALEEHKQMLAGAKGEAQALINEAKSVAQKEREQLLEKARQEQEQVLERARREIQAERERAIAELRREAVDLSLAAASKLIQQRLDRESDRKLVEQFIDTLGKEGE